MKDLVQTREAYICDAIQQNESELANIKLKMYSNKADKVFAQVPSFRIRVRIRVRGMFRV